MRILVLLVCTSLVFASCSKDSNQEPIEDIWKEKLAGSWVLVNGFISWDISIDYYLLRCRGIGSNQLTTDNDSGSMISKFDLDFHLDNSYDLSYSIPLTAVYMTCEGLENELPLLGLEGIEVLEGSDHGIFNIGVIPGSLKDLSMISLEPSIGETYYTYTTPILDCNSYSDDPCTSLRMTLVNFEKHFTVSVLLLRKTD